MASSTPVSPFAPVQLPDLPSISGVRFASCAAGIKYQGRKDLLLVLMDDGTSVAGVLTRSKTCSAPIQWCRQNLNRGQGARALVVNAGNANAFTGRRGWQAVEITAAAAAKSAGCSVNEVYLASTGVIGEPLEADKFTHLLDDLAGQVSDDVAAWQDAAKTIMTTDTFPKLATRRVRMGEATVMINGICKGSGMIAPDMATMLGFIFTDADLSNDVLATLLKRHVDVTFNSMTVDSDTSTSDTLLLFATGRAENVRHISDPADAELQAFSEALHDLMREMAILIAKDGEGISKFVTVSVTGAEDDRAARVIAKAIANSPLVKTAIAGEDANWGRVVMAVGKAGERADRDRLAIRFGDIVVARAGERAPDYDEEKASAYMKNREIEITADVGIGGGSATVWTCDLTHGYISINADYRS